MIIEANSINVRYWPSCISDLYGDYTGLRLWLPFLLTVGNHMWAAWQSILLFTLSLKQYILTIK